jgi:hypothetical protein
MVVAGFEGVKMRIKVFEESLLMSWVGMRQGALVVFIWG